MIYTVAELSEIANLSEAAIRERMRIRNIPTSVARGKHYFSHENAEKVAGCFIPIKISDRLVNQYRKENIQLTLWQVRKNLCLPEDYQFN